MSLHIDLTLEQFHQISLLCDQPEEDLPVQRLQIILLSASGLGVPDIANEVELHPINVRKWIHRFRAEGIDGLRTGHSPGRPSPFTNEQRAEIRLIASRSPRNYDQSYRAWSLARLRKYLMDSGVVESISLETIRVVLQAPLKPARQHTGRI